MPTDSRAASVGYWPTLKGKNMSRISRRTLLSASATTLAATAMATPLPVAPGFKVEEIRTISLQNRYHGWPTLTRCKSGELMVVCSGGRDCHVCPFGRVELIRSSDNGKTWTFARTILDGPVDDRDAGIVETSRGTLLVSTFTSNAYVPILEKARKGAAAGNPTMSDTDLARWEAAHRRLKPGQHEERLGCWLVRSDDQGRNWSPAYRIPCNSPHGPINLNDGRLMYAGISLWAKDRIIGVWTSDDDGMTWKLLSKLPIREGDDPSKYHELHAVQAADGRLVVQIRNHNTRNAGETLQTMSTDGGTTWTSTKSIGVWGLPSHLVRLSDDRILMTYGHRRGPLGCQARISEDHGQSWSEAMVLYGDGENYDLGYATSAELSPGKFMSVWYEKPTSSKFASLRMARWSLD